MKKRTERSRHPLWVLRKALKLTQKEMASIANCATISIVLVEGGKLKLSEKMANRLSDVTGVSRDWLLAGDGRKPIVAHDGKRYTLKYFEEYQAELFRPKETKRRMAYEYYGVPNVLGFALFKLYAILRKGYLENRFAWTTYKMHTGLDLMAEELGIDQGLEKHLGDLNLKGDGGENLLNTVNFIIKLHNAAFKQKARGAKKG